ncbi:FAD synthetase family protein [Sporosarcina newyorkensis]|uniref:FAD synthase n=2 Tax=Sporosarcina newyorkensis TaxID=759851 RepID=A0A1T4Y014_9BACL|nr:FAD synthetase family protein [Sporosarcina newyorkensis]EGQ26901.1 riboflavin biosynthesis protein RibF [Sporosarcina newyorkensis 2681]SKA95164.1 FAD synthetase [Sporosarcina newyorkensis]
MKVHKSKTLKLPECVLTIGALDGLHIGHQTLIKHARERAVKLGVPLVVYTFDPPPKVFFQHVKLLSSLPEKLEMLEKLDVDHVVVAQFNAEYISQGVERFLGELKDLKPIEICEGHDFRFGRGREGDVNTLRKYYNVSILEPVMCDAGKTISSTRIRELFEKGEVEVANQLLGWNQFKSNVRRTEHDLVEK